MEMACIAVRFLERRNYDIYNGKTPAKARPDGRQILIFIPFRPTYVWGTHHLEVVWVILL